MVCICLVGVEVEMVVREEHVLVWWAGWTRQERWAYTYELNSTIGNGQVLQQNMPRTAETWEEPEDVV